MPSSFLFKAAALLVFLCSTGVQAQATDDESEPFEKAYCVKCHNTQVRAIERTPHGNPRDERTPFANEECESCHGDTSRHLEFSTYEQSEPGGMLTFKEKDKSNAGERNAACLQCHQNGDRLHWQGGSHEMNDVVCSDCHTVHGRDDAMSRYSQAGICFDCHQGVKTDFLRPYAHPANEKITCNDCHEHHGSAGPKELKRFEVNQVCYDCHAEKRGPFLWEHAPASEDCVSCHRPHGSNHFALLKSRPPFLCQQCHANESGTRHIRQVMEFSNSGERARFIVGGSCMNCHAMVHGSNHPSGVSLTR